VRTGERNGLRFSPSITRTADQICFLDGVRVNGLLVGHQAPPIRALALEGRRSIGAVVKFCHGGRPREQDRRHGVRAEQPRELPGEPRDRGDSPRFRLSDDGSARAEVRAAHRAAFPRIVVDLTDEGDQLWMYGQMQPASHARRGQDRRRLLRRPRRARRAPSTNHLGAHRSSRLRTDPGPVGLDRGRPRGRGNPDRGVGDRNRRERGRRLAVLGRSSPPDGWIRTFLVKPVRTPLAAPTVGGLRTVEVIKSEEKGSGRQPRGGPGRRRVPRQAAQAFVVVSNDSDLTEPLRLVRYDLGYTVGLVKPHRRPSQALMRCRPSFTRCVSPTALGAAQFPDSIPGTPLQEPNGW